MADIPRDPRQLARDILAGKVRIEDLAKERQRAAGGLPPPRPPVTAERPPDKIPLPNMSRPTPPAPPPPQVRRPAPPPARPQQRPAPVKAKPLETRRPPQPVRATVRAPQQSAPPVQKRDDRTILQPAASQQSAYATPAEQKVTDAATKVKSTPLAQMLRSRSSLKQAIILAEVLNKPLSMRDS